MSEGIREGRSYLCAKVLDYGQGFFKEDMEFATEEFYRGDKSRHDRSHQGLGLAIVKRFWSHREDFWNLEIPKKSEGQK